MRIYKSIFFDAGHTLLEAHPPSHKVYCAFCKQRGIEVSPEEMLEVMKRVWNEQFLPRISEDSHNHETDDEDDKRMWTEFCREVFQEVGFKDGVKPVVEKIYQFYATAQAWRLYPEVREVIATLREKGLFVGVISNWNSALPQIFIDLGISSHLDLIVTSAIEGVKKPSPLIFQRALLQAHSSPEETLYIGDTYSVDVLGAQKAGIQAILLDRSISTSSEVSCPVISDLRQLLPMVR